MHGRPREYKHKLKDPKFAEGYKKKVDAIKAGTAIVLEFRKNKRYDEVALDAAAKLLKVVPEIYTLWNFRREALAHAFTSCGSEAHAVSDGELALTHACLMENPKSYSTWHHRKWVVAKGLCSLDKELALVTRALDEDQRNFHAWNYRLFITSRMGRPAADELAYTEEKIAQNFSNYSAWHMRTILLPAVAAAQRGEGGGEVRAGKPVAGSAVQAALIPTETLDEEYDMVHQAFATDSGDQSPWVYYRWLLGNTLAHVERARGTPLEEQAVTLCVEVLQREVGRFEEDHLAADPHAKWPLLILAHLKDALARLGAVHPEVLGGGAGPEALQEQVQGIYALLAGIDPMRKGYYLDAAQGKASVVVHALGM